MDDKEEEEEKKKETNTHTHKINGEFLRVSSQ